MYRMEEIPFLYNPVFFDFIQCHRYKRPDDADLDGVPVAVFFDIWAVTLPILPQIGRT